MKEWEDYSVGKRVGWIIGGVVLGAAMALLFGFIVKLLWNWLMTDLFHLPAITYWQAWGIAFLSHILFKGGSHGSGHSDKSSKKRSRRVSCDDNDCEEGGFWDEVKGEFREEFRKEFKKEFEKEFEKEFRKKRSEEKDTIEPDTVDSEN